MNRDLGWLLTPVVALVLLALVAFQTVDGLRASGAWSGAWDKHATAPVARPEDPFTPIGVLIGQPQPALPAVPLRDPFTIGAARAPVVSAAPIVHRPVVPPPPPRPVLTAIVYDADPRALVRWKGHDWTVRPGGLFDEFQVTSITRDQVTLSRGSETIVLQRKAQGD